MSSNIYCRELRLGLVTAFPPGKNSLNEFGWHLANSFASSDDIASLVIFCDETDEGEPLEIDDVEFVTSWKFNSLFNAFRLMKSVRKARCDVVLFNLQFATFGDKKLSGGLGLLAPFLCKFLGVKTVVVLHNLVENVDMKDAGFANNRAVSSLMQFAGRCLTRLLLTSDYLAVTIPKYVDQLRSGYNADNILLCPHGSFEVPDPPVFEVLEPQKLLAFGKWGTYKQVDILLDAYRLLLERGYNLEVVIAGTDSPNSPGYLADVQQRYADLDNVIFTGYVPEEDVKKIFSEASITVFPYTSTTGSSGVLHQAGSYGKPAVMPNLGDFVELIEDEGFVGVYFDPQDPASLADAISKLVDDDSLREDMGMKNFAASTGVPISEVADWHIIHMQRLLAE